MSHPKFKEGYPLATVAKIILFLCTTVHAGERWQYCDGVEYTSTIGSDFKRCRYDAGGGIPQINVCEADGAYRAAFELSLANELYETCASECVYAVDNGDLVAFKYNAINSCWDAYLKETSIKCWFNEDYSEDPLEARLDEFCFSTDFPTTAPSSQPTLTPTEAPSPTLSPIPTQDPTGSPTQGPTEDPTGSPTQAPTEDPTGSPTQGPIEELTMSPTVFPTFSPTNETLSEPLEAFHSVGGIVGLVILGASIVFCVCFWWMCHQFKKDRDMRPQTLSTPGKSSCCLSCCFWCKNGGEVEIYKVRSAPKPGALAPSSNVDSEKEDPFHRDGRKSLLEAAEAEWGLPARLDNYDRKCPCSTRGKCCQYGLCFCLCSRRQARKRAQRRAREAAAAQEASGGGQLLPGYRNAHDVVSNTTFDPSDGHVPHGMAGRTPAETFTTGMTQQPPETYMQQGSYLNLEPYLTNGQQTMQQDNRDPMRLHVQNVTPNTSGVPMAPSGNTYDSRQPYGQQYAQPYEQQPYEQPYEQPTPETYPELPTPNYPPMRNQSAEVKVVQPYEDAQQGNDVRIRVSDPPEPPAEELDWDQSPSEDNLNNENDNRRSTARISLGRREDSETKQNGNRDRPVLSLRGSEVEAETVNSPTLSRRRSSPPASPSVEKAVGSLRPPPPPPFPAGGQEDGDVRSMDDTVSTADPRGKLGAGNIPQHMFNELLHPQDDPSKHDEAVPVDRSLVVRDQSSLSIQQGYNNVATIPPPPPPRPAQAHTRRYSEDTLEMHGENGNDGQSIRAGADSFEF